MMDLQLVTDIIEQAKNLTKSPENYLTVQEDVAAEIKELTKKLYDLNKYVEQGKNDGQRLDELVIENLDEEQVWQQIELQNKFICNEFIGDIARLLVNAKNLMLGTVDNDESNAENEDVIEEEHEEEEECESGLGEEEAGDDPEYSDLGISEEEDEEEASKEGVAGKSSIVDDKFFKLSEMEEFLIAQEKEKPKIRGNEEDDDDDDDEEIDLFENLPSDSNDENERPRYNDFFDQPGAHPSKKKRKRNIRSISNTFNSEKRVKFAVENEDEDGSDLNFGVGDDDEEEDELMDGKPRNGAVSSFEARQERLKSRIKNLEEEALKEKPWQLKGEVTAAHRPQNSLLEEYVEFDTAVRPPPVMTEKTTLKLEDIIKQRIKDKAWDDVERKIKPVEDPKEYKKRLVLNQEKSKLSLAQIYEQEYLKQKEAKAGIAEDQPEKVPEEQAEIEKMMKNLFSKLDALSNFHFTPKMVTTEVKIVSNLPAISVEEVAPVGTSDAALLAPEEIKSKQKGELIGKSERTKTDKKRERRMKKKRQGMKQKEIERREKEKKSKLGKEKELSKKKKIPQRVMKKLGRNVSKINENDDGKYIKSSNAFFSRLQDEVKGHIKSKYISNNLEKTKKLDIKKLKL